VWWLTATTVANGRLDEAQRHGDAATALDDARTAVLQARSSESLTLVARSAGFAKPISSPSSRPPPSSFARCWPATSTEGFPFRPNQQP